MANKILATNYMTQFRCIGPECEDTCCQTWKVNLTQSDYKRIHAFALEKKDKKVEESLILNAEGERFDHDYGLVYHDGEGQCGLMENGWCRLHRDYGEGSLPVVCATFPRIVIERPDVSQVHGRLSCPEVVRLAVLSDNTCDLVEEAQMPERYETQLRCDDQIGYYQSCLAMATQQVMRLLNRENYSLQQRLYFAMYYLKRIESFLKLGLSKDPSANMERAGRRMEDEKFLSRIADEEIQVTRPILNFLINVLNARMQTDLMHRYNKVRDDVMTNLNALLNLPGDHLRMQPTDKTWGKVYETYRLNQKRIMAHYGETIDRWFLNFSRTYWAQYIYLGDANLRMPILKFLFYFAQMRLMFFLHPEVTALQNGDREDAEQVMAKVLVNIIQTFMKTFDSNVNLLKPILAAMEALNLKNIHEMAAFLDM